MFLALVEPMLIVDYFFNQVFCHHDIVECSVEFCVLFMRILVEVGGLKYSDREGLLSSF